MTYNNTYADTICALATSAGGAIAVIRVSGPKAISITSSIFHPSNGQGLEKAQGYTIHYGEIRDRKGNSVDEVLISLFHSPHSYTGEDSIEISCHGSSYIVQQILHLLIECGCRQARPGEYTQRAYLNGKMDLSQAEAVADLIASTNRASHQIALSQLKGHFSNELSTLRDQLLKLTSLLELELDFSDHEELEFADRTELKELTKTINDKITALAHSFETGNALRQGIPVAIVGKTNVGKSTLLNQLLHEEKAIVSDIDGTTRDVIEDVISIQGIPFRFIDTAGLRDTSDKVEQIGIHRAYQKLDEAAIVLWMFDTAPSDEDIADLIPRIEGKKVILVRNKLDLTGPSATLHIPDFSPYAQLAISAKKGMGIDELQNTIYAAANIPVFNENTVMVTSARHYEALTRAHESLSRVLDGFALELSGDLLSEDLRICLEDLSEITGGAITPQETLNHIFKHFCIGK